MQHNFGRNAPTKILNNVCDTAYRAGIYLVNINGATTEGQGVEVVNNLFLNGGWYGVDLDMHGVTNVPDGWVIDYNAYRGNWRALHWGSVAGGHTYSNAADVCASTVFEPHGTDCTGRVVYDAARFDYRGVSGSMLIDSGRDACSPTISNLIASVPFPRHGAHYDIGRYEFFADVPFLDVTTTPCTVQMPVNTIALAGTNAGVVGTMWWTNQHAAAGGVLPAAPAWSIASIPLVYGTNMISVTGTNAAGDACSDGVAIELIPEPASIWQCVLIVAGIVRRMRLAPHVN